MWFASLGDIFVLNFWQLMSVAKEHLNSLKKDLGMDVNLSIIGVFVQPLNEYIEHLRVEFWENCFHREFNGHVKPIGIQKSWEWVKQSESLQMLKRMMFKYILPNI
jgi:hypothetical protein